MKEDTLFFLKQLFTKEEEKTRLLRDSVLSSKKEDFEKTKEELNKIILEIDKII